MLPTFSASGIRRIVALRGDLPSGMVDAGEFRYANELVEFIRAETGDRFRIEVAAYPEWHPQAKSPREDLLNFKRKVDAGANSAITQYFYNADAYEHFVAEARALGIAIPIIPGIMPIASFSKLARFSDACGAEIPRWMRRKFEGFGDDADSIRAFGLDVVTELCQRLIERGAPGLHFYSMNQSGLTLELCRRLGWRKLTRYGSRVLSAARRRPGRDRLLEQRKPGGTRRSPGLLADVGAYQQHADARIEIAQLAASSIPLALAGNRRLQIAMSGTRRPSQQRHWLRRDWPPESLSRPSR
jgi:methylenetetrahydrofolate reductase (NADPH)